MRAANLGTVSDDETKCLYTDFEGVSDGNLLDRSMKFKNLDSTEGVDLEPSARHELKGVKHEKIYKEISGVILKIEKEASFIKHNK